MCGADAQIGYPAGKVWLVRPHLFALFATAIRLALSRLFLPPRNAAEYAGLFEHAELAVQPGRRALSPGAGHFPWLDDPAWFTRTLAAFLG